MMKQDKTFKLDEVIGYGRAAGDYARTQILAGFSHIESRALDVQRKEFLYLAVLKMRGLILEKIRESNLLEEKNPLILSYETYVVTSAKYSLGNSHELVLHAFDYMLKQQIPGLTAEVYRITKSDRYFLVLNKKIDSNDACPETWGDRAVICDPLSQLVYPAKKFYQYNVEYFNNATDKKHEISPAGGGLDLKSFSELRKISHLQECFVKHLRSLGDALHVEKDRWLLQKNRIAKRFGTNKQIDIIAAKIDKMDAFLEKIRRMDCHEYNESDDYREVKAKLLEQLEVLKQEAEYIRRFAPKELSMLRVLGIFSNGTHKDNPDLAFPYLHYRLHI